MPHGSQGSGEGRQQPNPPTDEALNRNVKDIDYIAFEGGAAFGLAYPSAMFCLENAYRQDADKNKWMDTGAGFKWPVHGVSGTSIGACFAYFFALGYSSEEITELAVRDGIFAKVFDEKFEYGRSLAATNYKAGAKREVEPKTRLGWYGDYRQHRRDDWCLNDHLLGSSTWGPADTEKLTTVGALGKIFDAEMMDMLRSEGLINIFSVVLEPLLKVIGLPDSSATVKKEITKFTIEVVIEAVLAIVGNPQKQLDHFSIKRLSDEIDTAINRKIADRFWMIEEALGDTPLARVSSHIPLILIVLMVVRIDLWIPSWRNKRKRGDKHDFLNKDKLDEVNWREVEHWVNQLDDDKENRTRSPFWHQMKLAGLAFLKNVMTDQNVIRHWRKLVPMVIRIGRAFTAPREEQDAFMAKMWMELIKFGWGVVWSPFTNLALKSLMNDGGLLNGQKIRDLLVYAGFNKCVILPATDGSRDWRMVRRPETLVKTLNRLSGTLTSPDNQAYSRKFGSVLGNARHQTFAGKIHRPDRFRAVDADLFYALDCAYLALEESEVFDGGRGNTQAIEEAWIDITSSMEALTTYVRQYMVLSDEPLSIPVARQFEIIEEELTFERFHANLGVDVVLPSANYTTSSASYWRRSLTPDFPVIEAARTAGAFPGLFKPTAIAYRPADDAKGFASQADKADYAWHQQGEISCDTQEQFDDQMNYSMRDWFYDTHYRGYFNDAGIFNNLPIHAFNGIVPKTGASTQDEDQIDPAEFHLPHESLQQPLNPRVLGIELTNQNLSHYLTKDKMFRPTPSPFARGYTYRSGLKTVLDNKLRSFPALIGGILNALYAMSGKFRRLDPEVDRAVLQVIHGNIGMWDMIPNENAIRDCYAFNIRRASYALGDKNMTSDDIAGHALKLSGGSKDEKKKWRRDMSNRLDFAGLQHIL